MTKLISLAERVLFACAFVMAAGAIGEAVVNLFGYTYLRGAYTKGRLLELAGVLLIFAIALLLRQVRDRLPERQGVS